MTRPMSRHTITILCNMWGPCCFISPGISAVQRAFREGNKAVCRGPGLKFFPVAGSASGNRPLLRRQRGCRRDRFLRSRGREWKPGLAPQTWCGDIGPAAPASTPGRLLPMSVWAPAAGRAPVGQNPPRRGAIGRGRRLPTGTGVRVTTRAKLYFIYETGKPTVRGTRRAGGVSETMPSGAAQGGPVQFSRSGRKKGRGGGTRGGGGHLHRPRRGVQAVRARAPLSRFILSRADIIMREKHRKA